MRTRRIGLLILLSIFISISHAQQGRTVIDLSGNNWRLSLDTAASWKNDRLYAPPVDLKALPVNVPTGGWERLSRFPGRTVHLPATVEEFYWGRNGNAFGVSGNYLGVSWFTSDMAVPATSKGKRVVLQFEAVRFRAEIFINQKLAGYDLVNSTPFEVNITDFVKYGAVNKIAIRITDPNGNFDWRDSQNFMWGDYRTNPTHGFGGITGKVKLVTTDRIYIKDVFIKNTPKPNVVDILLTTANTTGNQQHGNLDIRVKEVASGKLAYETKQSIEMLGLGESTQSFSIRLDKARLWSVDSPHLYRLEVKLTVKGGSADSYSQRFGFRWFEVKDVEGDRQYYLNGKRIVVRTAISWGFWPVNGIAPSDELARKQVKAAKDIGLNMLNFHRTIGNQNVLDYADELGLLYFEEPGGNQYPADRYNATDSLGKMAADFYFATRNEKLFRMIRRDRNHPSLVIYNMHNERGAEPQQRDRDQMLAAHQLDETRILTYNSSNGSIKEGPDPRFKLHLMPYDDTFRDYGWFDQHHAGGPGTYHDNLYSNPKSYLRYTDKKDEIIYYGEEGAIGTPPRLELIRKEILKRGKDIGWESRDYLDWYDAYDKFLKSDAGFRKAFPTVDALTMAMGNVAYYYQGRIIENIRINNTIDGYAVNGWESMKLENHSGIVDNYRNPKGDVSLIARYNKPLVLAVKMNRKVLGVGDTAVADIYIINEVNLHGEYTLQVKAVDEKGKIVNLKEETVNITGGPRYGELLMAGIPVVPARAGYTTLVAELRFNGKLVVKGEDQLYALRLDAQDIPGNGMVADTTGVLQAFLRSQGIVTKDYKSGRPAGSWLLAGAFLPPENGNPLVLDLLEWVNEGNTLVIAGNSDAWADFLSRKEVIDYRGRKVMGTSWYGGNFFFKSHPFFNGLPDTKVFNWEYQCFATYNKSRIGLRIFNGETVVASVADHKKEVYSALSVIPHGRGKIIISSLDFYACLSEVKAGSRAEGDGENASMGTFNASQRNKANLVGMQLLLNLLKEKH